MACTGWSSCWAWSGTSGCSDACIPSWAAQQRGPCNRSTYVGQSGGGNAHFPTLPRVDTAALPRGGAAGHDAVPWHSKIPLNLKYSGASVSQASLVSGNDRPWR